MKTMTIITAVIAIFLAIVAPIAYLQSNENADAPFDDAVTNADGWYETVYKERTAYYPRTTTIPLFTIWTMAPNARKASSG